MTCARSARNIEVSQNWNNRRRTLRYVRQRPFAPFVQLCRLASLAKLWGLMTVEWRSPKSSNRLAHLLYLTLALVLQSFKHSLHTVAMLTAMLAEAFKCQLTTSVLNFFISGWYSFVLSSWVGVFDHEMAICVRKNNQQIVCEPSVKMNIQYRFHHPYIFLRNTYVYHWTDVESLSYTAMSTITNTFHLYLSGSVH